MTSIEMHKSTTNCSERNSMAKGGISYSRAGQHTDIGGSEWVHRSPD